MSNPPTNSSASSSSQSTQLAIDELSQQFGETTLHETLRTKNTRDGATTINDTKTDSIDHSSPSASTSESSFSTSSPPPSSTASPLPSPSPTSSRSNASAPESSPTHEGTNETLNATSSNKTAVPSSSASARPSSSSSSTSRYVPPSKRGLTLDPVRQTRIDAGFISAGLDVGYNPTKMGPPDPSRVLECWDFPPSATISTQRFKQIFGERVEATHWVNERTVLIVFDSSNNAAATLKENKSMFKLRSSSQASKESQAQLSQIAVSVPVRPKADTRVASRLLSGHLGIRHLLPKQTPEEREQERKRNEERRRKQAEARAEREQRQKEDAW